MYRKAGVDLAAQHRVGLGSVCRRGSIAQIGAIASRDLTERRWPIMRDTHVWRQS